MSRIKIPIKIPFNYKVKQIKCGTYHTIVLADNNEIFTWGNNECGQIGNGTKNVSESSFNVKIGENSNVKSIVCGESHSLVLFDNGTVYGWGDNSFGQLALETNDEQLKPIKILENIKEVVCGYYHTLALSYAEFFHAFGDNGCGQLWNETTKLYSTKINMKFKEIAAYKDSSMGITLDGECYIWGSINDKILLPKKVDCKTLNEVFALYFGITNKTIRFE